MLPIGKMFLLHLPGLLLCLSELIVYFSFSHSFIVVLRSLCLSAQFHLLIVVFAQLLPFSALAIDLSFTATVDLHT